MQNPKAYTLKIGTGYSSKTLPYRFPNGEQAVTFRNFLNQMNKIGGVHKQRTIDMSTGNDVPPEKGVFKVVWLSSNLTMKWDRDQRCYLRHSKHLTCFCMVVCKTVRLH